MPLTASTWTAEELAILECERGGYCPTPEESVLEWTESVLWLSERQTAYPGPFSLVRRPYLREPLETFKIPGIDRTTLCTGTQVGKTTLLMAGLAWSIVKAPAPVLWIMPNTDLARSFSKTRWQCLVEDCDVLRAEKPNQSDHFSDLEQQFRRCTVKFVGSNSPANISSRPVGLLIADEIDKFAQASEREPAALSSAEHRTKDYESSKMFLASSPTTEEGEIWQFYLRGDQRRYHLPCPHCSTWIVLEWSGVKWDRGARLRENEWDLARVQATAAYQCPHCNGAINDSQKLAMLPRGEWRPTNSSALPGERSYHLSSLYSPSRKCSWGALAVRFLQDKASLLGLQGFINGYLAEPWRDDVFMDATERVEIIAPRDARGLSESPLRALTVDVQAGTPHFYWVVREWAQDGHSRALGAGTADIWEDLRKIQGQFAVADHCVLVDSGFSASEVYVECLRYGKLLPRISRMPLHVGWMPTKGQSRRGWRDPKQSVEVPYYLRPVDPLLGDARGGSKRVEMSLLEFATDWLKDILARLRKQEVSTRWEVAESVSTPEYWRQMDSERKIARYSSSSGRIFHTWLPRTSKAANHYLDCEVEQIAFAVFQRRLRLVPVNIDVNIPVPPKETILA